MRRPLEELVEASGQLAAGDLGARVTVGGLAETATLGAAFNEMAADLQRRAGERDRLDRMKDEFVLTASHELRSPLTSVQGFAELLMLEREQLSPRQAETVEIILDNTRHLVRLLNDLLDLARSDAGRLTIKPVPTDPAALIAEVVRTMRGQTEAAQQALTEDVAEGLPMLRVDPDRIRQVLLNLLTNAHEYCPERASIRIAARPDRCKRGDQREGRRTRNPGGPARAHLRAVHPWRRRADSAGRRHGPRPGDLEVPGRAARRVDRRRVGAGRGIHLQHPAAGRGELMAKVLVADDSETILLLLRTRLEMEGHEVETATDGQEVMDTMHAAGAESAPDLLLLDAMMPGKSGIEALRELRAEGVETPALIVSAHQNADDAGSPTELEVSGYVTKPIDFDSLFSSIKKLTG